MKKLITLLLSVLMILSMTTSVLATGTATIEVQGTKTGHTFKLYQLLTGTVVDNAGEKSLTGINFGANYPHSELDSTYLNANAWADHLKVLTTTALSAEMKALETAIAATTAIDTKTATGNTVTFTGLDDGYYLLIDQDTSSIEGDAHANYIVRVAGAIAPVTINLETEGKIGYPTLEKKVKEDHALSIDSYKVDHVDYSQYNDTAAYSIGDAVPFVLAGSLPSNYGQYDTYKYEFYDTLADGLTYKEGSIKVYVVNGSTKTLVSTGYTTNFRKNSSSTRDDVVEVKFANLKSNSDVIASSYVVVEYTATLNENANLGTAGNINKAVLKYSNDPKASGSGSMGKTPEDETVVYTFGLDLVKLNAQTNIHGTHTPITGAGFTLQKATKSGDVFTPVSSVYGIETGSGTGIYKICAAGDTGAVSTFNVNASGELKFIGIDEGYYVLTETVVPTGFVTPANPIDLEIAVDVTHTQTWDGSTTQLHSVGVVEDSDYVTVTSSNTTSGVSSIDVFNTSMAQLPTTGGAGTTALYVTGAALMIAAGVLLVVKKRMGNN